MPVIATKSGITRYWDNAQWDAMDGSHNGWTLVKRIDVEKPEARRPFAEIAPPRVLPTDDPLLSVEGEAPIIVNTINGIATVSLTPGTVDGYVLTWNDSSQIWEEQPPAAGTVTSVSLDMPTDIFDVSGSPVTGSGGFTVTLDTQAANTVFAGPTTGSPATPAFRALVLADLPSGYDDNQIITLSGDVTGSGATSIATTIASDAVTFAKMQNIATQRVIGRNTAGPGDPEEVTVSQVLDWISSTQGAILYRGASSWAALAPGTSGYFLKTQGGGANPVWDAVSGGSITGSGVANRIAIWTGTSTLSYDDSPLLWDATNNLLGVNTTPNAAVVHIANTDTFKYGLRVDGSISSGTQSIRVANTSTTGSSANALLEVVTGGTSAGDPYARFTVTGGSSWSYGIDNSDSDSFKISSGTVPGTSDRLIINTSGNVGIGTVVLTGRLNVAGSGTTSSTYSMLVNNNSATTVFSVRDDQRVGILTTSPSQELHVNGDVIARQYINTTATPSGSFGTGAGTGPALTILSGGVNFIALSFTTGTSPTANGNIITITLNQAFPSAPTVVFSPRTATTATDITKFYIGNITSNSFTLTANGTLSASTPYQFFIHVGGY